MKNINMSLLVFSTLLGIAWVLIVFWLIERWLLYRSDKNTQLETQKRFDTTKGGEVNIPTKQQRIHRVK